MTKILIITLYCGENEYAACQSSVKTQNYAGHVDHIFIENLPNVAAHKKCYQTIMDRAGDYDLFVKLDADMVLSRHTALNEIAQFWNENNHPDHMTFAVHDYISDQNIIGIHVFSQNCRWYIDAHDDLFVDPNPRHNGTRTKTYSAPAPFASHASNPSDQQAYHYGLHRAMKAFQWGRRTADIQGLGALKTLLAVAAHYKRTGNIHAHMALTGAESIRTRTVSQITTNKDAQAIKNVPIDFWLSPIRVILYGGIMVAPRIVPFYIG